MDDENVIVWIAGLIANGNIVDGAEAIRRADDPVRTALHVARELPFGTRAVLRALDALDRQS